MTAEEKKTLKSITGKVNEMDKESKAGFIGAMLGAALMQDLKEVRK